MLLFRAKQIMKKRPVPENKAAYSMIIETTDVYTFECSGPRTAATDRRMRRRRKEMIIVSRTLRETDNDQYGTTNWIVI